MRANPLMTTEGAVDLASPTVALRVHRLPGGPIVRDYIAGRDLSAFFSGHYSDPQAYERKAAEVDRRMPAAVRARVAAAIEPLGDSAERLRRILSGDGYFVTTGQQPALFGGPLYTVYKILGAIRLAERLERQLGRPVLALFWVGSDDHDWTEANHTYVLDGAKYARRIEVRGEPDAPPLPLYQRAWGGDVLRATAEFAGLLPKTAFARDVVQHIHEHYTPDATVAASFTATMRWVLRDRRVAFVDSAHAALRSCAAGTMRREVEHSAAHNERIAAQTRRLEQAGYPAQVTVTEDAANLMRIDEHGRDRLVRSGSAWSTRRSGALVSDEQLLRDIETHPERYSPNVLLRPVVENAVFPTIAYVAGPGELSYFAQLGCLFEAHGILAPVIVPRPSMSVIDEKLGRKLRRLGIEPEALARPFDDVVAELVSAAMPASVSSALSELRTDLEQRYERLARAAETIDPTLRGPLIAARNRALLESRSVEKRITAQLRRLSDTHIEQLRRLAAAIQPNGSPQERAFGPLALVASHGRGIVDELLAAADIQVDTVAAWTGPDCR